MIQTTHDEHLRILVVEDDPVAMEMVSQPLRAAGHLVTTAAGTNAALDILRQQGAQMVVSDWIMPDMDGIDFCRRVRAIEELGNPYFIMLTVHTDKARLAEAFAAGVNDFISKPFEERELLARVNAGSRVIRIQEALANAHRESQRTALELMLANEKLATSSITDELTGLYNYRHAVVRRQELQVLAQREGLPLTCLAINVDSFKSINDTYGHSVGDQVLRQIARILKQVTRESDLIARMGGDEFMVMLLRTAKEGAGLADRLCRNVASMNLGFPQEGPKPTLSIGVAQRPAMADAVTLTRMADEAMYAAKASGRNTFRLAGQPDA